jgi:hypothetical protein
MSALPFPSNLFEDQIATLRLALDAKRFAVWSGCGLGKTPICLEWARQVMHRTGGRVLIVTLNEIVQQFIEEAKKFYGEDLPILRLNSRQEMRDFAAGRMEAPPCVTCERAHDQARAEWDAGGSRTRSGSFCSPRRP